MRNFRKIFLAATAAAILCGCEAKSDIAETTESSEVLQTSETETSFKKPEIEAKHYSFDEIGNISDEELIGLADYADGHYPQNLFIEDYFEPLEGEYFDIEFVPEGADLDEYCREERHYFMYHENDYSEFINRRLELFEDNDVFSAWLGTCTEIRDKRNIDREDYVLFMKNFSEDGWRYTGKMTADEIARNFDVRTYDNLERKVCRRVVETEDAFIYEYYFVQHYGGDWNVNCEIELGGRALYISKEDGSFPCEEQNFWDQFYCHHGEIITYSRTCEIPDSAPKQPWDE